MPKVEINVNIADYDDDDMIHGHPPMEDARGGGNLSVEFYDATTYYDAEETGSQQWKRVRDWFERPTDKKTVQTVYGGQTVCGCEGDFANVSQTFNYHYIGNAPLPDAEAIAREYGDDNDDKWNRLPLMAIEERASDGRWLGADESVPNNTLDDPWANPSPNSSASRAPYGKNNIRFSLKRNKDDTNPPVDISPDLIEEEKAKGRLQLTQGDFSGSDSDAIPFKYAVPFTVVYGSFGVKVEEIGTKSIAHYLKYENSTLSYSVDWLEDEETEQFINPFYNWFDTTDTDKFKVTKEPRYDADETGGTFIKSGVMRNKLQVYMVPRTWCLSARVGEADWSVIKEGLSYTYFSTGDYVGPVIDLPERWYRSTNDGLLSMYSQYRRCYPSALGTGFVKTSQNEDGSYNVLECATLTIGPIYTEATIDEYVGLWWDLPPVDILTTKTNIRTHIYAKDLQNHPTPWTVICPSEAPAQFLTMAGAYTSPPPDPTPHNINMVAHETKLEAISNYIAAGGNPDNTDFIVGGFTSLHCTFAPPELFSMWAMKGIENFYYNGEFRTQHDFTFRSKRNFQVFHSPIDFNLWGEGTTYKYSENTFDQIGSPVDSLAIERTLFWEDYGSKRTDETLDEENNIVKGPTAKWDIPTGYGLSPTKAGTLVGIVKVGETPYYVWRKTDEVFSFRVLVKQGEDYGSEVVATFTGNENTFETHQKFGMPLPDLEGTSLAGGSLYMYQTKSYLEYNKLGLIDQRVFNTERRKLETILPTEMNWTREANPDAAWVIRTTEQCWAFPVEGSEDLVWPVYILGGGMNSYGRTSNTSYMYEWLLPN